MRGGLEAAVRWIGGQLKANPGADRLRLVDEASRKFDLSPKDGEFLMRELATKKS